MAKRITLKFAESVIGLTGLAVKLGCLTVCLQLRHDRFRVWGKSSRCFAEGRLNTFQTVMVMTKMKPAMMRVMISAEINLVPNF